MAKTFRATCWVSGIYNQETAKFLEEQWGVTLRFNNDDELKRNMMFDNPLQVEVHDYPEIMEQISKSGYVDPTSPEWQIQRISGHGITLYLVNYSGKSEDGENDLWEEVFIFIPMNNVIAVHNISQQFFINEVLSHAKE